MWLSMELFSTKTCATFTSWPNYALDSTLSLTFICLNGSTDKTKMDPCVIDGNDGKIRHQLHKFFVCKTLQNHESAQVTQAIIKCLSSAKHTKRHFKILFWFFVLFCFIQCCCCSEQHEYENTWHFWTNYSFNLSSCQGESRLNITNSIKKNQRKESIGP